jgi:hypothetical protein
MTANKLPVLGTDHVQPSEEDFVICDHGQISGKERE